MPMRQSRSSFQVGVKERVDSVPGIQVIVLPNLWEKLGRLRSDYHHVVSRLIGATDVQNAGVTGVIGHRATHEDREPILGSFGIDLLSLGQSWILLNLQRPICLDHVADYRRINFHFPRGLLPIDREMNVRTISA